MKLSKKLIPAIGMLMLSAVMLVTSSFAWFSMNTTVSATGMQVSAKGDQVYLQIVAGTDGAFDDKLDQTSAAGNVAANPIEPAALVKSFTDGSKDTPVAYTNGSFMWTTNTSGSPSASTAAGVYKTADSDAYYNKSSFKIRLNKAAGKEEATAPLRVADVKFSATAPADSFSQCVSVFVTCTFKVGETDYIKGMLYKQTTKGTFSMVAGDTFLNSNNGKEDGVFANTTGVQVDVYVFFDGENGACTLNALKTDGVTNSYSVDVYFSCLAASNG